MEENKQEIHEFDFNSEPKCFNQALELGIIFNEMNDRENIGRQIEMEVFSFVHLK